MHSQAPLHLLPLSTSSPTTLRRTRSWHAWIILAFVTLCGIGLLSRRGGLLLARSQPQIFFPLESEEPAAAIVIDEGNAEAPTAVSSDGRDTAFKLGSTDPLSYRHSLTSSIFSLYPMVAQPHLLAALERFFPLTREISHPLGLPQHLPAMAFHKNIWQTDKNRTEDQGAWSWLNKAWKWELLDDIDADFWVEETLSSSRLKGIWNDLPVVILVSTHLSVPCKNFRPSAL